MKRSFRWLPFVLLALASLPVEADFSVRFSYGYHGYGGHQGYYGHGYRGHPGYRSYGYPRSYSYPRYYGYPRYGHNYYPGYRYGYDKYRYGYGFRPYSHYAPGYRGVRPAPYYYYPYRGR